MKKIIKVLLIIILSILVSHLCLGGLKTAIKGSYFTRITVRDGVKTIKTLQWYQNTYVYAKWFFDWDIEKKSKFYIDLAITFGPAIIITIICIYIYRLDIKNYFVNLKNSIKTLFISKKEKSIKYKFKQQEHELSKLREEIESLKRKIE